MRKLAILLGGALVLAGCQATSPAPPPPPVDMNNALMARGFLAQAASGNEFEIQSSQLALQVSQNPAVRNFASLLIAHHRQLGQAMAAAAVSAGLTPPPPALLPQQQAMLDQLRLAGTGQPFDMAFRQAQIDAHQQTLSLMQNYATSGDVPALRTAAANAIPTIQMHLQQAQVLPVAPPPPAMPPAGERGERG